MIAGLPYDAEVEYLKGNSSQYIDTGKTVSDKTEVELWFTADQYANTYIPIFGVYQSDGYLGAQISYGGDPTRINAWRGSSTKTNIIDTATLDQRSGVIELKNGKWGINGTFRDFPSSAFKSTSTAWYNKVNGLGNYGAVRKIGYIKIWENGTIVFNAIPVRLTNEQGVSEGAMYDRVSRRLFRNAGTGSFTVGPDVATPVMGLHFMPKPPPYDAKVEYLKSTGTQYIQLGFGFDPSDEIEASFSIDTSETNDKYMNASQTWNSGRTFGMGVAGGGKLTMAFGNAATTSTVLVPVTINDGAFHTWKYDNMVCSVTDLSVSYDMTGLSFSTTTNLLRLFFGYNSPTKGKIAYYKHKKNGVLMCDFIPVRFTNELGQSEGAMYDNVSKQIFRNQGTGAFTIGPDIVATGFRRVKYITRTSGDVWFPTGVFNTDAWTLDSITKYGNSSSAVLFGAKYSQTYWSGYGLNLNYGSCRVVHGDQYSGYFTIDNVDGLAVHCECTAYGCSITWGEQTRSITSSAGLNGEQIYLLGNGNFTSKSGCMGETKITRRGILLAHLFPCVRISDGAPVFYDSVSNRAITNTGTGTAGVIEFS